MSFLFRDSSNKIKEILLLKKTIRVRANSNWNPVTVVNKVLRSDVCIMMFNKDNDCRDAR